jgi:predicted phage-related endonuclease
MRVEVSRTIVRADDPWRSCTPDGLAFGEGATPLRGLEIKCRGEHRGDEWGDPGTDEVPPDVAIQAHWSMDITGIRQWDVCTLIGGNRFGLYHLYYDEEIAAALRAMGLRFWQHVLDGTEPPVDASEATTDYLRAKFGTTTGEVLEATVEQAEKIHRLLALRTQLKSVEEDADLLKNELMAIMGSASQLVCPDGSRADWKQVNGSRVDWKAVAEKLKLELAELHPVLAESAFASIVTEHSTPNGRRFQPYPPKKGKK